MTVQDDKETVRFIALCFAVVTLPILAFAGWDQALNFDPCDNIFKPPSRACESSPSGYAFAGMIAFLIGAAILSFTVRNGRRVLRNWIETLMMGWVGLSIAVLGAAMLFVALNLSVNPLDNEPAPDRVALAQVLYFS